LGLEALFAAKLDNPAGIGFILTHK
jgi:hypothetical protein